MVHIEADADLLPQSMLTSCAYGSEVSWEQFRSKKKVWNYNILEM